MMKLSLFSVILALCISTCFSQTPIPNRPDGYAFGGPADAPIILEGFFDALCPDCAAGWPTIKTVVSHYGNNLRLLIHTFPLPYHTWAFIANQGVHVIYQATKSNSTAVSAYYDLMFGGAQQNWWNANAMNMSSNAVISSMAAAVEKAGILSASVFSAGINDANINNDARISWKYSCSRAVTGTPTFLINGVYTSADDTYSPQDWYNLIDPLLQGNSSSNVDPFSFFERMKISEEQCPKGETLCTYAKGKSECCKPGEACIPNVGCRC